MNKSTSPYKILICTVGGNSKPIVTSIKHHKPDFTTFVCTDGTLDKGTIHHITGSGKCIKSKPKLKKHDLPNIPSQASLPEGSYDTITVEMDSPEDILETVRKKLNELKSAHPNATIISDYTGGTKSMSVGLILATLEHDDVDLYVTLGNRDNLIQVTDGTEIPMPANTDKIRFDAKWDIAMSSWRRYGYEESVMALSGLNIPGPRIYREKFTNSRTASCAFAAWDRFQHNEALRLLDSIPKLFGHYFSDLKTLTNDDFDISTAAKLCDLKLNMSRRAETGNYDDAVARAYRLLEWTAQWLLKRDAAIDTIDVPKKLLPPDSTIFPDSKGRYKVGLYTAWLLLGKHGNDNTKHFFSTHANTMKDIIAIRNNSILAHGFTPIDETGWKKIDAWFEQGFYTLLKEEARASGINKEPQQLPVDPTVFNTAQ